ncbi:hypothetical protein SAMN06265338_10314 [Rhodoblastus acidophilus]|uniref:Uncharacterized protein n=1 Tax=Rhodoblastus acidophilus TaxID=1074 RepID=A0A212R7P5_RHOAC|nr:hypothetical protein [Rhodoblastus acidophilus]MCW2317258.1 hypothetical protein [Rhodoblastus acidophilus]PPQ37968.1 hypothetical protein CKO16_12325 [Rhodoblastus acidophilus]RAI24077.1 hypothetical protein CH337_02045 [Rhodoblastus acidophilus]SNB68206.1 hypothetical protein SAMN06265338_10314 [Rhodoblastus acidophilus]
MANSPPEQNWKIDASEHERQGFATCTDKGVIVWRGSLTELADGAMPDFDVIYCHDKDVDRVWQAVAKGQLERR